MKNAKIQNIKYDNLSNFQTMFNWYFVCTQFFACLDIKEYLGLVEDLE